MLLEQEFILQTKARNGKEAVVRSSCDDIGEWRHYRLVLGYFSLQAICISQKSAIQENKLYWSALLIVLQYAYGVRWSVRMDRLKLLILWWEPCSSWVSSLTVLVSLNVAWFQIFSVPSLHIQFMKFHVLAFISNFIFSHLPYACLILSIALFSLPIFLLYFVSFFFFCYVHLLRF